MAKIYERGDFVSTSLVSMDKTFTRLNGQPFDESEIWTDLDSAKEYAKSNSAYVGQKIVVVDLVNKKTTHYSIENAEGDLKEIGSGVVIEVDASLTEEGKAADAKAVGDQLKLLEEKINNAGTGGIISSDDGNGNVTLQTVSGSLSSSCDEFGNVTISV